MSGSRAVSGADTLGAGTTIGAEKEVLPEVELEVTEDALSTTDQLSTLDQGPLPSPGGLRKCLPLIGRNNLISNTEAYRRMVSHETSALISPKHSRANHRVVTVPEYEYIEVTREVPETRIEEKIVHVEVVNVVEETIYVPKIVEVEKLVEIPQIEYREIPVERIIEIPEIREQVHVKEIPKDQYVEVDVPEIVEIEDIVEVKRNVPRALESVQHVDFHLPRIKVVYEEIPVVCYTPVFIEVPVPVEQLDQTARDELTKLRQDIEAATGASFPSLSALEDIANRSNKFRLHVETDPDKLLEHWQNMARQGLKRTVPSQTDDTILEGDEEAETISNVGTEIPFLEAGTCDSGGIPGLMSHSAVFRSAYTSRSPVFLSNPALEPLAASMPLQAVPTGLSSSDVFTMIPGPVHVGADSATQYRMSPTYRSPTLESVNATSTMLSSPGEGLNPIPDGGVAYTPSR